MFWSSAAWAQTSEIPLWPGGAPGSEGKTAAEDVTKSASGELRGLPLPYLYAGFVKLDVGDADRPWVRTFAAHRLGLPDLAQHLGGHQETSRAVRVFAGILGYLRQSGERFEPGDGIDPGGDEKLRLRAPTEAEWYLESEGTMLVVEDG